ncbi:heme-dependent oxidative N-demethylase family protein [Salipiger aestuarii]|uniref:heme-dependent oxidative N-demethylase family protein n=1 Tax=Salipiger aestuarii TaxID=568098 RepID=UPI00123927AA|nr:DUF3445 domain-containing protein [Salipiger aestuarii]KAA8608834.1 hypothetical protein AL037_16305 [Salipiger aestuarii]
MILQETLPFDLTVSRPLPNVSPVPMADWLHIDSAFAGQMAERDRLILGRRDAVHALTGSARPAARELLDLMLGWLPESFRRDETRVIRPDGVSVSLDRDDPLVTAGRLVQEDLCLLQKPAGEDEHVLTGAVLCFPAGWRLADKMMRPLTAIHTPIPEYDDTLGQRVQRLFDGVRPGHPLMRFNRLWHDDPALFQPGPRRDNSPRADPASAPFFRTERQCIVKLPETGAALFSIHTYVLARARALALSAAAPA